MKRSMMCRVILLVTVWLLAAAPGAAEESNLPPDLVPSLSSDTYRQAIEEADSCIVLYYRSDLSGTSPADAVMKALINALPTSVKFYKVDLRYLETAELERVIVEDIERDVVPSIIPYRAGAPLNQGKVRGPPRPEWTDDIVEAYIEEFRPGGGGDSDRWEEDWPER